MEAEKNKVPVVNQCEMSDVREILFLPQPGKIALRISYLYVLSDGIPKRLSNSLHLMPGRISLIRKPLMMAPFPASPVLPHPPTPAPGPGIKGFIPGFPFWVT